MNTSTINISLPLSLLKVAKSESKKFGYASVSEYIRQAIRNFAYGVDKNGLTVNGFTPEFEDMVLVSAKEPVNKKGAWKTPEDVDKYFRMLENKVKKDVKGRKVRQVPKHDVGAGDERFAFAS